VFNDAMMNGTQGDPLTHPDNELPRAIGRPATNALHLEGIYRLDQVVGRSERELLALHGVGPKAIRLLKEALAEQGMSFSAASVERG
jgi:predicted flap endonuclease-1-like 5' DNA nuclease